MDRKGSALIIILVIVIALIVVGGIWYWQAHQSSLIRSTPTNTSSSNTSVATVSTTSTASGLQITEPTANQVFAPGATVNVTVQTSPALDGTGVMVGADGMGQGLLQANYLGNSIYKTSFIIPEDYAGAVTITSFAITGVENDTVSSVATGTSVIILVQSTNSPTSMADVNGTYLISATSSENDVELDITGYYPNGVQRDITASSTGTTYQSDDTAVVTVAGDGIVTPVGFGQTQVIARNGTASTTISFVVENPDQPLAAQNFTSDFAIQTSSWISAFAPSRNEDSYTQTVTVTNKSSVPIVGPLYLVFLNVPGKEVEMAGWDHFGVTNDDIQPHGTPYIRLPMPTDSDGLTFDPGQSVSLQLNWSYPVGYTPEIIRTTGNP